MCAGEPHSMYLDTPRAVTRFLRSQAHEVRFDPLVEVGGISRRMLGLPKRHTL